MDMTRRTFGLFGKARTAVLSILFCHSDKQFYVRQIVRAAGMGHGIIQRELAALTEAGLIIREQQGNQTLYRANTASPMFGELRGIMMKTAGLADILRASLIPLSDRITSAFIYGSLARGDERADSDVDVMVVGHVMLGQVVEALHSAELELGREINPQVFSPEDFSTRLVEGEHFATSVMAEEKLFLIGDEDGLRDIAERGQDRATNDREAGDN